MESASSLDIPQTIIAKNEFFIVVRDNQDNDGVVVVGEMIRMGSNAYCHIVPDDDPKMNMATANSDAEMQADINRHVYGLQYECNVRMNPCEMISSTGVDRDKGE